MTDRLAELQRGAPSYRGAPDDVEAGLDPKGEAEVEGFAKESAAIDKVLVWARTKLPPVEASLSDPAALASADADLSAIERKLNAVRARLKRIAGENKTFVKDYANRPGTVKSRVAQYSKLGDDFVAAAAELERVREAHRNAVSRSVKDDILRGNPGVTEGQVDRAMASGGNLESVLTQDTSNLRHQVEEIRERNAGIRALGQGVIEIHNMMTEMQFLVEKQQELVNDIEYNVDETKQNAKKGVGELEEARRHQKSARKKKICICVICILIIVAIACAVIIPVGVNNGWFSGGSDRMALSSASSDTLFRPATEAARKVREVAFNADEMRPLSGYRVGRAA